MVNNSVGGMSSISGKSVLVTSSGKVVGSAEIPKKVNTISGGSGSSKKKDEDKPLAVNLAGENKIVNTQEGVYTETGKFYPTTAQGFIPKGFEQGYGYSSISGGIGLSKGISGGSGTTINQQQLANEYKLNSLISSGEIVGFSGTTLNQQQIAKKELFERAGIINRTDSYGEYFKATTPQAQVYLNKINLDENKNENKSIKRKLEPEAYTQPLNYKSYPKLDTGQASPFLIDLRTEQAQWESALSLATLGRSKGLFKLGKTLVKKLLPTTTSKIGFLTGELTVPYLNKLNEKYVYQPKSRLGKFAKAGVEGAIITTSPFLVGAYLEQLGKSAVTNPYETGKSFVKNYPETLGFIAGGGLKVEAKLPKLDLKDIKLEKSPQSLTFGKEIQGELARFQEGVLKVSYQVPFTIKQYKIDLLKKGYEGAGGLELAPLEFRKEQSASLKEFKIFKGEKIKVGNLRLDRLKDIPKDLEVYRIIEQFLIEKNLPVGGTTAIETVRVGGKAINLRRIPRDLEAYDPRTKGLSKEQSQPFLNSLAKELAKRLQDAGKEVSAEGNQIKFKGIEGHGVNFQNYDASNLERYRDKVYPSPSGVLILDPVSQAFNKVYDLYSKRNIAKEGSKKAEKLKKDSPESYEKSLYDKKSYLRYPKDTSGYLSFAEQFTKLTLEKYKDFTKRQIPIYQEYKMARFGQAKELIKPYLKKLKLEEAKIEPYYYKGKQAGVFSGIKYIDSYTLYLEKNILKETRASISSEPKPEVKTSKEKLSDKYYYLDENGKRIGYSYPKVVKSSYKTNILNFGKLNYPLQRYNSEQLYPKSITYPKTTNYPKVTYPKVKTETYPVSFNYARENYPQEQLYPKSITYPKTTNYPKVTYPSNNYPKEITFPKIKFPVKDIKQILKYDEKRIKNKERSLGQGYFVYGKNIKSNNLSKINSFPVSRSRAEDIGGYYVLNTLARTFKVVKANKPAEDDFQFSYIPQGFYSLNSKRIREFRIRKGQAKEIGEIYIQKNPYLLSSQGEKKQIKNFQKLAISIMR